MSDYFHEQMVGKMKLEVTVPIDNNTTFPVKILTEGRAKGMVLKALEDVRAEIEEQIDRYDDRNISEYEDCLAIIDRKIKEIKHE